MQAAIGTSTDDDDATEGFARETLDIRAGPSGLGFSFAGGRCATVYAREYNHVIDKIINFSYYPWYERRNEYIIAIIWYKHTPPSDNHIHPGDSGLYVSKITANGAAAKDGRLAVGDRIISVNGFDCKATTHADAVAAFKV